nr:CHASE domain-containing protein [Saccharobesus litoralis]
MFAKLGLLFAIPPGFASAIWPAAGIGLAIYLKLGRWALLGTFLGSTLANSQVGIDSFFASSLSDWLIPSCLALGTCLQLILARCLIYRYCELPIKLYTLRSIVKFALLAGPMACIVACSVGATVLTINNDLSAQQTAFIWLTWWVGDSVGTLFFTPLVLLLFNNQVFSRAPYRWKVVAPSLIIFVLVSSVFFLSRGHFNERAQLSFVEKTQKLTNQILLAETEFAQHLYSLAGLIQASEEVTRDEFKTFTTMLNVNDTNLRALGWIPKVEHKNLADFYKKAQSYGFSDYSLKSLNHDKQLTATPSKAFYLPILFLEPYQTNQAAVGLELTTHPVAAPIIDKAVTQGTIQITPPLTLAQQRDKFTGFVAYYPLFKQGTPQGQTNYQNLMGITEVVIEIDTLLSSIYKQAANNDFHVQVIYQEQNKTLFNNGYNKTANFHYSQTIEWFSTPLTFNFASSSNFDAKATDWTSWITLILGCLLAVISTIFIMIVTGFNHKLELEVTQKTAELEQTNQDLIKANNAKSQFLANMSHEYRTPLNAIVGFSQIGRSRTQDPKVKDYFNKVLESSEHLLNLINNVLDLTKMDSGKLNLIEAPFSLSDVVQQTRVLFEQQALDKNITFNIHADIKQNQLIGDKTQLEQILVNLCSNAVKFTQQGQVKLTVTTAPINSNTCTLTIKVEDQGIGIDKQYIDGLFDAFTQADESNTRAFGGTGLGLTIVKQLVDLMQGTLNVQSELNVGSTFTVELPLKVDLTAEKTSAVETKEQSNSEALNMQDSQPATDFSHLKVLLVEDNEINQIVAREQLKLINIQCEAVNNGQQALDHIEQNALDLLLLDLHMPVLNGFDTAYAIRSKLNLIDLPIIALTASVSEQDKQKAAELGINHYLTKPFNAEQLRQAIEMCFAEHS